MRTTRNDVGKRATTTRRVALLALGLACMTQPVASTMSSTDLRDYVATMVALLGMRANAAQKARAVSSLLAVPSPVPEDMRARHLRQTLLMAERLRRQSEEERAMTLFRAKPGVVGELRTLKAQGDLLAAWWLGQLFSSASHGMG